MVYICMIYMVILYLYDFIVFFLHIGCAVAFLRNRLKKREILCSMILVAFYLPPCSVLFAPSLFCMESPKRRGVLRQG